MKRMLLILCCMLLLSGCASLAPDEYLSITPHQTTDVQAPVTNVATAGDYRTLKKAILNQVRAGQTEGVIHVTEYNGALEDDLRNAAYEVSKLDPLGAYAVDYMTHSCTRIVSYYEIRIYITFRRTAVEIAQIQSISNQQQLQQHLEQALNIQRSRLAIRLSGYRQQEKLIPTMISDYCAANADRVIEPPQVSVSVYPEEGSDRIMEVNFVYTHTPQELRDMREAVRESIHGAAEYIRYREGAYEKADLLYSYLTQRFQYRQAETVTPLYDALCGGIADPTGISQAWQLICDEAGMECYTVHGMKGDEPYTWNMLHMGDYYRHLDLAACMLSPGGLVLRSDPEMGDYYWSGDQYPVCEFVPEPEQEEIPEEIQSPTEEDPLAPEAPTPDTPDEETAETLPQS